MTYFGFLFRFLLIPILVFLTITYWDNKSNRRSNGFRNGGAVWIGIAIHVLLAVVYTTPWDNYLVATGVWYYNPDLVTGIVLGYVPIEEYTFFVLETILAGLWWWFLTRRLPSSTPNFRSNRSLVYLSACLLVFVWLVSTYLFFFGGIEWTYLSIILFWALPPIILQILFGADILWHYRKLVFWSIFLPGMYLSLIDILALKDTTWSISPTQTTGILFFGILPLEEVVFFFVTNMLITFGMTLLLANVSQERFTEIKQQIQSWREKDSSMPGRVDEVMDPEP
jgi:lycopene cyclase domain-containing protein